LRSYLPDDSPIKDQEIGLEESPEQYITRMVEVFRAVREVLNDDGTLWVNIGDSYAGSGKGASTTNPLTKQRVIPEREDPISRMNKTWEGIKRKDLIGIPWMLAFALRADGWYLRQDIIWEKGNSIPEARTDRCVKSHEYIFLLSKQPTYYFDHLAIREPTTTTQGVKHPSSRELDRDYQGAPEIQPNQGKLGPKKVGQLGFKDDGLRNKRSVWTVNTKPFKEAHFATFPVELIEPCILAGSKPGDVILDPFMGSGTTAMAALVHDRKYLGCELNEEYRSLQQSRIDSVTSVWE
jgi:DNA modification methylase